MRSREGSSKMEGLLGRRGDAGTRNPVVDMWLFCDCPVSSENVTRGLSFCAAGTLMPKSLSINSE